MSPTALKTPNLNNEIDDDGLCYLQSRYAFFFCFSSTAENSKGLVHRDAMRSDGPHPQVFNIQQAHQFCYLVSTCGVLLACVAFPSTLFYHVGTMNRYPLHEYYTCVSTSYT
jgi:hypothetical protein